MTKKLREFDCGTWDTIYDHNRITVRERPDGLFDVIHVRYVRTVEGLVKSESPCAVFRDLAKAKEAAWAIWRELREAGGV